MNKYQFRIKYFEETGGWLSEDALEEFYEVYENENRKLDPNFIECPKCGHMFNQSITPVIDQQKHTPINNHKDNETIEHKL